MAETKPLASLSGSLLARKGAARPAMRRQGMAGPGGVTTTLAAQPHDDLGWNDMGYDVNPDRSDDRAEHQRIDLTPMLTPIKLAHDAINVDFSEDHHMLDAPVPEVVRQREVLARKVEKVPALPQVQEEEPVHDRVDGHVSDAVAAVSMPALSAKTGRAVRQRAAPGSKGKAAFTLRIDPERHLRLRLASAITRRSAQAILIDALDKYLKNMPEINELAHHVPES